tara:strand:+ start:4173 stop:4580 length:408 start_codon:yes stop_codon:yes gene_type:complete
MSDLCLTTNILATDITTNKNLCQDTEFICIFCKGISKYQNITKKLDNTTLLCPYCHVDNMILNNFNTKDINNFNIKCHGETFKLLKNNSLMISEKYIEKRKKTIRLIYIDNKDKDGIITKYLITTYFTDDITNVH